MNSFEMKYEFELLLQTISDNFKSVQKPDTDTIFIFINLTLLRYVKEKYLNKPTIAENIAYIQNKSDDLRNLIEKTLVTPTAISTGSYAGIGYTVNLASLTNYLFYIRSDSKLSRVTVEPMTSQWMVNRIADSYMEVDKILTTGFNKPILREPIVVFKSTDTMNIIVDSYTTISTNSTTIDITYLRKPKYLTLTIEDAATQTTTCELAEYTHEEIVKLAVESYIRDYKFKLSSMNNEQK